jgi:hypothetical protein
MVLNLLPYKPQAPPEIGSVRPVEVSVVQKPATTRHYCVACGGSGELLHIERDRDTFIVAYPCQTCLGSGDMDLVACVEKTSGGMITNPSHQWRYPTSETVICFSCEAQASTIPSPSPEHLFDQHELHKDDPKVET